MNTCFNLVFQFKCNIFFGYTFYVNTSLCNFKCVFLFFLLDTCGQDSFARWEKLSSEIHLQLLHVMSLYLFIAFTALLLQLFCFLYVSTINCVQFLLCPGLASISSSLSSGILQLIYTSKQIAEHVVGTFQVNGYFLLH